MKQLVFTAHAIKDLKKFPVGVRKRILTKMEFIVESGDPLGYAKRLTNFELGEYRFRVGDYRVVCDVEANELVVLLVGHRREIYR